MLVENIEIKVESSELDLEYKHLHHSKYFLIYEQGRTSLMKKAGVPLPEVIAQGLFPVVTEVSVSYLREVKAESYRLETQVSEIKWRTMLFEQTIYDHRDKIVSQAKITCMILSKSAGRAISVPEEWKRRFL